MLDWFPPGSSRPERLVLEDPIVQLPRLCPTCPEQKCYAMVRIENCRSILIYLYRLNPLAAFTPFRHPGPCQIMPYPQHISTHHHHQGPANPSDDPDDPLPSPARRIRQTAIGQSACSLCPLLQFPAAVPSGSNSGQGPSPIHPFIILGMYLIDI